MIDTTQLRCNIVRLALKGKLTYQVTEDDARELLNKISSKKIIEQVQAGEITIDDVDEELVSKNLYTGGLADPNLIIRTSGEERLSGFLLWQSSYSELYFCETLWPELRKVDFIRAIRSYQERERRFGV